jgi:hypothetical protein
MVDSERAARRVQFEPNSASGEKAITPAASDPATHEEGAALIRAFLRIERRDLRAAIIALVNSLSETNP